jgi:hypothetical protein
MSLGQLVQQLRQLAKDGAGELGSEEWAGEAKAMPAGFAFQGAEAAVGAPAAVPGPALASGSSEPGSRALAAPGSPPRVKAARPAGGVAAWAALAVVLAAALGAVAYALMRRRSSEPQAPDLPDALRRRLPAPQLRAQADEGEDGQAEEAVEPRRFRTSQRQAEWGDEDRGERAGLRGPEGEGGPPDRHVRFDEHVMEYPIPARRISRKAQQGAGRTAPQEEEQEHEQVSEQEEFAVPQIRIDAAQRFES